jgi:hypothetical protein
MFFTRKTPPASSGLERRVAELEAELAALKAWRSEVSSVLSHLDVLSNAAGSSKAKEPGSKLKKGGSDRTLKFSSPPLWFCSYCWANSRSAFEAKEVKDVKGDADPRELCSYLKSQDLPGWLDKEQLGDKGLFDDIVEGLLDARVMVAFISDEYAVSENCLAEFTFAKKSLRIPVIPVIVGTGWNWQKSKLGLLLADSLYIDMTDRDPSRRALKREELKQRLQELVGNNASEKAYLEQTGQVANLDEVKVGDVVEKLANDPLNFSASFQKTPIKEADAGSHLFAYYWWPCEVIAVNPDASFRLHYFGYGDEWDCTVTKEQRPNMIRPMQYPTLNLGSVLSGDRVEVRLYQDTHVADKNAGKAYCWCAGTVLSCVGGTASVKLDLDTARLGGEPIYAADHSNRFTHKSLEFPSLLGFDKVTVSVNALRRI